MKIVVVFTLVFFLLLHLTLHRMAFFFSLSLSLSQHDHALLVSKFVNMIKSSNLVMFFAISVIVMAIFFLGSSKPSCGDFTSCFSLPPSVPYDHQVVEHQEIEKAKDEDCDDFVPRLVYIEYKNNDFASCFSLPPLVNEGETAKDDDEDDDNNKKDDFVLCSSLPALAYEVEYEDEKAKAKDCDDIDNNDDFVPSLVYIEYKEENMDEDKNDGSNNDAASEDEEDEDDLDSRIEEFMAKIRKNWREELLVDKYLLRLPAAS